MSPLFVGPANSTNKFLGNLSSDPGSGNAEGDLYFNTTDNVLKEYDGSAWNNVNKPGPGESAATAIESDTQASLWLQVKLSSYLVPTGLLIKHWSQMVVVHSHLQVCHQLQVSQCWINGICLLLSQQVVMQLLP